MSDLPIGWKLIKLGEIAQNSNKTYSGENYPPVLSVTKYRGFVLSSEYFNKRVFSKNLEKYKLVHKGEFAYATIHLDEGSIDVLKNYDYGLISPMYTVFKVKNVDSDFLIMLLKSDLYIMKYSSLGQGSIDRRMSIPFSTLSELEILYPPINEQKKIAAILKSVNRVIELTSMEIVKLKELKKGMMQELLTKGIGHTKFKDTPVGKIPESWNVLTLSNVFLNMFSGVSVNSENRNINVGEFGIMKSGCVSNGRFLINEHKTILPSEICRAKIPIKKGSIVISRMSTPDLVGQSGYVETSNSNLFLPDRLWQGEVFEKFNAKLISYILVSSKVLSNIQDHATGTSDSMKNISKEKFLSVQIPIPNTKKEQDQIADMMMAIDKKIFVLELKYKKIEALRKGLMNDLFTGRVKVLI